MKTKSGFSVLTFLFAIALLAAIAGVAALSFWPSASNRVTTGTPSPAPTAIATFPPLWGEVEWGEVEEGEYLFIEETGEVNRYAGFYRESKILKSTQEYLKFYEDKLKSLGWKEVDYASGPEGESISYIKSDKHLTVGYRPKVKTGSMFGYLIYD